MGFTKDFAFARLVKSKDNSDNRVLEREGAYFTNCSCSEKSRPVSLFKVLKFLLKIINYKVWNFIV